MAKIQILTEPKVELISYTPNPQELISRAFGVVRDKELDPEKVNRWLRLEYPHTSPLEHVVYNFEIVVSRACWSQLQEHRMASHTAQSHRIKWDQWTFMLPPCIKSTTILSDVVRTYEDHLSIGIRPEDARYFLPMATCIKVIWSNDLRNLVRFWLDRTQPAAQWEIRYLANETKRLVKATIPNIDIDAIKHL